MPHQIKRKANHLKIYSFLIALLWSATLFFSCGKSSEGLENGTWRATLKTESGTEIPFNFIVSDTSGRKVIYITNAGERFRVDDISVSNDSVTIKLPLFDSEIKAEFSSSGLNGKWIRHLPGKEVAMEFAAEHGVTSRFLVSGDGSGQNVTGRWSSTFVSSDGKDTTIAVGEFTQDSTKVTGTFLTTTGDYRYLEGALSGDKLFLSTFDGSHAFLFTGRVKGNTIIDGKFYAGLSSVDNWTAKKDPNAMLPDAYSLTRLKPGYSTIDFNFPDLNGNNVSLSSSRFKNKVVIVQFLGSWCPNCMDESGYLAPFYKKNKSKGVEVVGLAYERTTDTERSKKSLQQLRDRLDITYPILLTGYTNKEALKSMPALNEFKAFPTTIVIDKRGKVRSIHTGFSGPGTGKHYTDFVMEFEKQINDLLRES
ncbi:peroxiredoxin [Arcticibacter tournemirensis]|uniref:TlpA family protein disulfide reductase n=1 Tax=Arcticibacter tournemirensis TaxID=699437 RepID=A0A543GLZ2_9SPHI|nr:TlpA disulfide reductase family protein [Arcticibacter tournemirensis]KAA8474111.1 TlpA family protein disulfide reductase [Arcticibacter tournemirensis]TQM47105.1 peroxiredoxin [Arcticibacter tournemirensis]TQM48330.1 peroxiredoxin [Arcticibacter tournemirensis]